MTVQLMNMVKIVATLHFYRETEKILTHDIWSADQDLNPEPLEYEAK